MLELLNCEDSIYGRVLPRKTSESANDKTAIEMGTVMQKIDDLLALN